MKSHLSRALFAGLLVLLPLTAQAEPHNPAVTQMVNSEQALRVAFYEASSEGNETVSKPQVEQVIDQIRGFVVNMLETHPEVSDVKCEAMASGIYEELMKTPLPKVSAQTSENVALAQASYAEDVCHAYFSVRR